MFVVRVVTTRHRKANTHTQASFLRLAAFYCLTLLRQGDSEKGTLPNNIRVFNKVGDAYGQLLDVAYIVDFGKNIEFFLSAVMYCNSDGILNDDKYDYETIGFPFMKHLGEVIYEYETKRVKKIEADLSGLKFVYDKE